MPTLERLAASLAVTTAVVVPAAALLLHDSVCPDEGGSTVQRFVSRLERAGVFNALTDGVATRPGACRAMEPPVHEAIEGRMRAVRPEVLLPPTPPSPSPPSGQRLAVPGGIRSVHAGPPSSSPASPHGGAHRGHRAPPAASGGEGY